MTEKINVMRGSFEDVLTFQMFVGIQLGWYADGEGDQAHDVLYRIQKQYVRLFGDLPKEGEDE